MPQVVPVEVPVQVLAWVGYPSSRQQRLPSGPESPDVIALLIAEHDSLWTEKPSSLKDLQEPSRPYGDEPVLFFMAVNR